MSEQSCHTKTETECIKVKAYELWEKGGRKSGHDIQHWLNAEKAVKTQSKK